jgi:hypothetical protein
LRPEVTTGAARTTNRPWRSQGSTHHDFLGAKVGLVEATHGIEGFAGAEQEATGRRPAQAKRHRQEWKDETRVQRYDAVEPDGSAAAHRSVAHGIESSRNGLGCDLRIRIDEHEQAASCHVRPRVAGRRDLAMLHADDDGFMLEGDLRGSIGGSVVRHDDLVRLANCAGRIVDRLERCAEEPLFVVGRDDERDHGCGLFR